MIIVPDGDLLEMNDIYLKIKQLCAKHNISISRLEEILKLGNGTIRKWKTASPMISKLEKVADYFNVSIDYLLGRSPIEMTVDQLINDENCISLQRGYNNLSPTEQNRMLQLLNLQFENVFPYQKNEKTTTFNNSSNIEDESNGT